MQSNKQALCTFLGAILASSLASTAHATGNLVYDPSSLPAGAYTCNKSIMVVKAFDANNSIVFRAMTFVFDPRSPSTQSSIVQTLGTPSTPAPYKWTTQWIPCYSGFNAPAEAPFCTLTLSPSVAALTPKTAFPDLNMKMVPKKVNGVSSCSLSIQ